MANRLFKANNSQFNLDNIGICSTLAGYHQSFPNLELFRTEISDHKAKQPNGYCKHEPKECDCLKQLGYDIVYVFEWKYKDIILLDVFAYSVSNKMIHSNQSSMIDDQIINNDIVKTAKSLSINKNTTKSLSINTKSLSTKLMKPLNDFNKLRPQLIEYIINNPLKIDKDHKVGYMDLMFFMTELRSIMLKYYKQI